MIHIESPNGDKSYQKSPTSSNENYGNPQIIKPDAGKTNTQLDFYIKQINSLLDSEHSLGARLFLAHALQGRQRNICIEDVVHAENLNGYSLGYLREINPPKEVEDYFTHAAHLLHSDLTIIGARLSLRILNEARDNNINVYSLFERIILEGDSKFLELYAIMNQRNK